MKEYMLLMRGGDARMASLTEEETQQHMQQWGAYMGSLAEQGKLIGGLPFGQGGKLMTKNGVEDVAVKSEAGEVIGGYLLIKAADYDEAVFLSKACPIFEHDGNIEIRELMPME